VLHRPNKLLPSIAVAVWVTRAESYQQPFGDSNRTADLALVSPTMLSRNYWGAGAPRTIVLVRGRPRLWDEALVMEGPVDPAPCFRRQRPERATGTRTDKRSDDAMSISLSCELPCVALTLLQRRGPQRSEDTRRVPGGARPLTKSEAHSAEALLDLTPSVSAKIRRREVSR